MHDELRELVREFICPEEFSETEEMNRFLIQVRDFAALLAEKDLGRVEALNLCFDKLSQYRDSDFRKMPSLRFLKVADANTCGDFSDVFTNLRWLHWEGCPRTLKATNFNLKSLVILNLSWSKVTSIWEGWSQIKATNSLKVLNLTGCINLITTPNFSNFPNLEILILEQCSSLVRIDPSIQCLDKLQFLNLKFCTELTTLPKELGSLKALTEILINGTSIRNIPISIGHLVSLETLSASNCVSLTHLPSSISYLTSLSELTLDGAQIHELSDLIGELKNLRKLSLKDCIWMQKLPESIINLKYSLIQLDVSGTGISEFPNSVQDLQTLKVLKMNSCFIRVFPKAICYLSNLEELHASHCRNLESDIPPEIERLRCLKILRLGFSRISSLPHTIFSLPRLQNLDLDHCNMLSVLPNLPSSLRRLCFNSIRMVKFPSLLHMHNLEELILADSDSEELLIHKTDLEGKEFWIPQLPKLKTMELCRSGIHFIHGGIDCTLLRKLTLSCVNLEFLPLYLPLLTLSVHRCQCLEILEAGSFPYLVELQVLDSAVCCIRDLGSLKALRILNVSKCQVEDLDGLEKLSSLVMLTISHCKYLKKLPNLSKLVLLRSLAVSYCDSIESLPNLSELEMLKEVVIHCCEKLSEIHGLEDLRSLEKVQVTKCEAANLPKVVAAAVRTTGDYRERQGEIECMDSKNEEDILDEGDDDVEEEHEHEDELEVLASREAVVKIPVEPSTATKETESQLSKKETKKKELAELEALLADFGVAPKDTTAQDDMEVVAASVRTTGDYPERPGEPECVFYLRTGACKFGAFCKFHHPKHGGGSLYRVSLNNHGYPLRPGEPECSYYLKTGQCKFGITCKFHHPQQAGSVPASAHQFYSQVQSLTVPIREQYGRAASSLRVAGTPFLPGSYVQGADGHKLIHPEVVPMAYLNYPCWAVSSAFSPGAQPAITETSLYDEAQLTNSSSPTKVAYPSGPSRSSEKESRFPERPGEPICQYYMKIGNCKFGSSCKYHHPRERISQDTNFVLSPLGFPLRPGMPKCSFYNAKWALWIWINLQIRPPSGDHNNEE